MSSAQGISCGVSQRLTWAGEHKCWRRLSVPAPDCRQGGCQSSLSALSWDWAPGRATRGSRSQLRLQLCLQLRQQQELLLLVQSQLRLLDMSAGETQLLGPLEFWLQPLMLLGIPPAARVCSLALLGHQPGGR